MTPDHALRRSRLKLLALITVFALPMLTAWVMVTWRVGIPEQRTAHGELSPQVPLLADWPLEELPSSLQTNDWILAFDCDAECDAQADQWWRLHRALGREADRVSRLRVGGQPTEALPGETQVQWSEEPEWRSPAKLWILDPQGRAAVSYTEGVDAADVLDDLQQLLDKNPQPPGADDAEVANR
ncbi:MAG TPA: hypothetical protein VLO12_08695 [Halomonas sp.]|nr:hypothetical protein [Halomonas sp.]